jgi:hypothetical protein
MMTEELTDALDSESYNESRDSGFDVLFGDEADDWPERAASKGVRASWFVSVFSALLLLVMGVTLGAYLQRGQSTSSTSSLGGVFGSSSIATSGASGLKALSKAAAKQTTGTVTDIVGKTLYVTTSSGSLVAVKVSSSTTVDRNASTTLSGLKPGDSVTVQGAKEKNGSVQATSISDTAKGVTSTGFGGGAFP